MKKVFAPSMFVLLSVVCSIFVNFGCSVREVKPNPETITSAKPQESIFTVIEMEDVEYPTVEASIHLPFRVRPNNTVVISGKHAYVTTERHLHVIDVSSLQRPSYLTSIEFADEIGKAVVSGNQLVVASRQEFHLVDISQPSHPVLQSTMYLPQRNAIKDLDVRGLHLYVIGENDSLYIFAVALGQARLVKVVDDQGQSARCVPRIPSVPVHMDSTGPAVVRPIRMIQFSGFDQVFTENIEERILLPLTGSLRRPKHVLAELRRELVKCDRHGVL